jgi:hypothetical protein
MRYWLNSADRLNPEEFSYRSVRICDIYRNAIELHKQGIHIVSTDEKTGMQALERAAPTLRMKPGYVERQEQDYIRHGTLVLIANFEVATGRILLPTIGETRTEQDFVDHIAQTFASDPEGKWIFIGDQLNSTDTTGLVQEMDVCTTGSRERQCFRTSFLALAITGSTQRGYMGIFPGEVRQLFGCGRWRSPQAALWGQIRMALMER